MAWVLDLDGVVWLGSEPIPGASEAIARLRAAGEEVFFVTNASFRPVGEVEAQLADAGIDGRGRVLTSAVMAVDLVEPGETVLVAAGPGVTEALEQRGVTVVTEGDADAVMVGFHLDFTYDRMRAASLAVRNGARLIATNDDATYPTTEGLWPGGGAILASIERATGTDALVAGKPYPPAVAHVHRLVGTDGNDGGGPARHRRSIRSGARLSVGSGAVRGHGRLGPARRAPTRRGRPTISPRWSRRRWAPPGMTARRRLDAELVRRGLVASRSQATELIGAGRVLVGGAVAAKPARMVAPGEALVVQAEPPPFVSRGGLKLAAALDHWPIPLAGRRVIDVGSSTGGFTDCALQRGAAHVVAIDVGRAQLHERMRQDPRVSVHEQTNVRGLDPRPGRRAG